MTRIVFKERLPDPGQTLSYNLQGLKTAPEKSVLHVALQFGEPFFWFEHENDSLIRTQVQIICVGTGWDIPEGFTHIGTLLSADTGFVWHYYIRG